MTEKNLRSCIKYCSKSLYLLQSEGGCLPIEHPLERGKDGLTVRSECVFYVSADASSRRRCAAFRALLGVGRRGAAGAGKRPQPYCGEKVLQRVIRGKMRVFASGERSGRFLRELSRLSCYRQKDPASQRRARSRLAAFGPSGRWFGSYRHWAIDFTGQSSPSGASGLWLTSRIRLVLPTWCCRFAKRAPLTLCLVPIRWTWLFGSFVVVYTAWLAE